MGVVHVVSGILRQEGKILLGKRRMKGRFPGKWELPGGKVEGKETHRDALRRELEEELDITLLVIGRAVHLIERKDADGTIFRVSTYDMIQFIGAPIPKVHETLGWFSLEEVKVLGQEFLDYEILPLLFR